MKPILLATRSKYKIALFQKLGLPFQTRDPAFDERSISDPSPAQLALKLAQAKARALAPTWADGLVIGADQVLALGDQVLSKPGSVAKAVAQLQLLTGKTHELHTAAHILDTATGQGWEHVSTSRITFHEDLNPAFLERMVIEDQTTDCVGSYKFESKGVMLMKAVDTPDGNAIVGLPLAALIDGLQAFGAFPDRFTS